MDRARNVACKSAFLKHRDPAREFRTLQERLIGSTFTPQMPSRNDCGPDDTSERMKRERLYFLAIVLAVSGCDVRSPVAPDIADILQNEQSIDAGAKVQISGWVYANANWADPPIADALVAFITSDGSTTTARSDATGYYELTVPKGTRVGFMTTSKAGYLPTTRLVTLDKQHTVLNFFLSPL